ncbi:MAG: hypothetical protein U1E73_13515 [Planctomycetota bacterium]
MSGAGPLPGRSRQWFGRLGFASAVFACVALPVLVAGLGLGEVAAPGEVERLDAARTTASGSLLADALLASTSWWFGGDAAVAHGTLVGARLSQLAALFVLSALVYTAGVLARGRLLGVAACLALACLPPVSTGGHVLRAETWAAVFALLGLVLLQCLLWRSGQRRRVVLPLVLTCAVAVGLAVATAPTVGTALLVPIVPFLLAAVQALLRGLRVGQRRSWFALPAHAITARLWGPGLAALLAPVAALVLMVVAVDGQGPPSTALGAPLLPVATLARGLVLLLAGFGGAAFLLGAGARFGRGGRLGPELALAAYCTTQLLHVQFGRERDPTPAVAALALLSAHGLLTAVAAAAWFVRRRTGA